MEVVVVVVVSEAWTSGEAGTCARVGRKPVSGIGAGIGVGVVSFAVALDARCAGVIATRRLNRTAASCLRVNHVRSYVTARVPVLALALVVKLVRCDWSVLTSGPPDTDLVNALMAV